MQQRIKLDVIKEALENNVMPFCLDFKTNVIFKHQLEKSFIHLMSVSPQLLKFAPEISEFTEDEWTSKGIGGLLTVVLPGWLQVVKNYEVYYLPVKKLLNNTEILEHSKNRLLIAYSKNDIWFSKDLCIVSEIEEEVLQEYFSWVNREIIHLGGIGEFYHQFSGFFAIVGEEALFSDDKEELEYIEEEDFPQEHKISLENMKQAIIREIEQKDCMENKPTEEEYLQTIEFFWNDKPVSINFPVCIEEDLEKGLLDLLLLDNKNQWLKKQNLEIQQTTMALWCSFVSSNLHLRDPIKLNWENFRNYVLSWLRKDCSANLKKIELKLKTTPEYISYSDKVRDFRFTSEPSDFFKIIFFIEKQAADFSGKYSIIDVENISNQHFYTLSQDHVLLELWSAVIYEKLIKVGAHETFTSQFDELKNKFPNFKEVIDYYSGAMHIFQQTGIPPNPVLLLGSPGLGKTHFANALAKIIGSQMLVLQVSSLTAGWIISGSAAQWKDATMGKVASALLNGPSMSPVLVLDEIDKKSEGNYDPLGALYPLLENETAKSFMDEFLEFPLDASKIVWVATANQLHSIAEPILDRFTVFDIPRLNEKETLIVMNNIYADLSKGLIVEKLSEDIVQMLKDKTPRQIKNVLKKGLAYAASSRKASIDIKVEHLDIKERTKKIGF